MNKNYKMLNDVVEYLLKKINLKAVILFGSRARGDWKPWSDYDILIIADFKERYLDRLKTVLEMVDNVSLEIEPHPYTMEEVLEMLEKGNPIIVDALEEGKILYSTKDFEKLMKAYEELKRKGLKKTETTIVLPHDNHHLH